MHPRSRTLRSTLGLVMLAALVVLVLSACGGTEKEAKPRPLPEGDKVLQPGEYRSEEFEPSLLQGWQRLDERATGELRVPGHPTGG